MAKQDKASAVAEITEGFRQSNAAVLTEYRGLTVAQLKELRRSLGADTTYSVVKNTLTKIAAREAGISAFEDLLQGPSAIAFVKGDPVEAAKGLRAFSKAHPLLVIKGAVLDGKPLSVDEIRQLADLESREVLLARMAGALQASLQNAVSLFAAPLAQTARVIDALRQKAEADPSVLAGGAGVPVAAAEATTAEAAPTAEADASPEAAPAAEDEATPEAAPAAEDTTPDATPSEDTTPSDTNSEA